MWRPPRAPCYAALMEWYLANPDFGAAIIELISWAQRQEGEQAEMVYNEAFATMRTILEAAATGAGQPVDPDTIDALTYIVSTLSDGFALNWLVFTDRTSGASDRSSSLSARSTPGWPPIVGDARAPAAPYPEDLEDGLARRNHAFARVLGERRLMPL